ncbi:hypothetical protein SNEBB_000557 [Seison nebaliae]|nr:hypothetical protein SNEBB_000557 [Seison nebaliae]
MSYIEINYNIPHHSIDELTDDRIEGCDCEDECNPENCTCSKLNNNFYYLKCSENKCTCKEKSCMNNLDNYILENLEKLELYDTNSYGMGVRSKCEINRDQFVCEYHGEWISEEELQMRYPTTQNQQHSYILTINENSKNFSRKTIIDATDYGNIARFINNGCDEKANLKLEIVYNEFLSLPHAYLKTTRNISKEEELLFEYGGSFHIRNLYNSNEPKKTKRCLCGSVNCCGYLN